MKLYLIPGTGTDKRLFTPQCEAFSMIIVPEWLPALNRKESIASYARRLSAAIDTSSPFILGGVSLGGMIAQEMALLLKPEALLLISTCSTSKAIPLLHRLNGRLMRALPNGLIKFQFKIVVRLVNTFATGRNKGIYAQMLRDMPPELIRWQSGAATEWALKHKLTMPVFHIHGAKDKIVPLANVKADTVIANGGHLINVTHSGQVNSLIKTFLSNQPTSGITEPGAVIAQRLVAGISK